MHFVILQVCKKCVVAFKTELGLPINLGSDLFQNSACVIGKASANDLKKKCHKFVQGNNQIPSDSKEAIALTLHLHALLKYIHTSLFACK